MKFYDKKIMKDFLISRLILMLIVLGVSLIIKQDVRDIFMFYDNEWYLKIANSGYSMTSATFFPLIPLIIKFFSIIKIPVVGTVLLNVILTYFSGFLIYKLSDYKCAKLWFFSPIAIFCSLLYTESIFVFLTLFTIYLYKNNKYLGAGICLGLSVMTRSLGSMLFFAMFIFMFIDFIKKNKKISDILKMYIPATIISLLYPVYLQFKFGNWKLFVDSQFMFWNRESGNIISIILKDIKFFFETDSLVFKFNVIVTLLLLVMLIYLIYKDFRANKNRFSINSLYLVFSILVIYSSCRKSMNVPSTSFYRYFLGCSSVYLLMNNKNLPSLFYYIVLGSFYFLFILCALWFSLNVFFC